MPPASNEFRRANERVRIGLFIDSVLEFFLHIHLHKNRSLKKSLLVKYSPPSFHSNKDYCAHRFALKKVAPPMTLFLGALFFLQKHLFA